MPTNNDTFFCEDDTGLCCPQEPASFYVQSHENKPLEIYLFIDPLCPESWAFEPIVKKLQMDYSPYFQLRYFLGNQLRSMNPSVKETSIRHLVERAKQWDDTACRTGMPCDGNVWKENPISTPKKVFIALKAAELQGKVIGVKYMRQLREALFLHKKNIAEEDVLIQCSDHVEGMDRQEFEKDLYSETAEKAYHADLKTMQEMDVQSFPTLLFFNDNVEEPGLKVPGDYDYEVYENVLTDMLGETPEKCPQMPLEQFLSFYRCVATKEISVVYDWSYETVEKEMKKLQLKQKVEAIPHRFSKLWYYIGQE
ncbi:ClpXP adapter SpxH family protein [Texcoconibacillus texcoconensis]|uniref:ClpXP adapter protein SpxH n=1 Tax=Texcoconibacillus texcoconensis TaxID=1095777 RepID=A0A840QU77_9BACI|nr:ClpXP adapter SpxH family protein [Texcoconibacillus texcoconensis]MBB5174848.1 putative DsbA family dithiol-disulfide isomerase [Texcoconibacillus texcoconensis]